MQAVLENEPKAHVFYVPDQTGDTKIMWDSANDPEVANARRTFDELRSKGYLVYKTDKKGEKAERMTVFDPTAERLIASAPLAGG